MGEEIFRINPEHLAPSILDGFIYPDLDHHFYWSDCWDPGFYVALARQGFISICTPSGEDEWVLLPEIQKAYAVLDWDALKMGKTVRRFLTRLFEDPGRNLASNMEEQEFPDAPFGLTITSSIDGVLEGIQASHGNSSWLYPPYRQLMTSLAASPQPGFRLLGVELRDASGRLRAGELGYAIGSVYTSLSGFLDRGIPGSANLGKAQLYGLAGILRRQGFAFWNLGHPYMKYKLDLGARILDRQEFLDRWFEGIHESPQVPGLHPLTDTHLPLSEALGMTGLFS